MVERALGRQPVLSSSELYLSLDEEANIYWSSCEDVSDDNQHEEEDDSDCDIKQEGSVRIILYPID